MQQLATWLEAGGTAMYLLLFGLAPLLAISGLLHLILASRNSFLQLCIFLVLTLGLGVFVTNMNRSRVSDSTALVRPEERLHLAIRGYHEANLPFELSLAIVLAGMLPYALGEIRRGKKRAFRAKSMPRP